MATLIRRLAIALIAALAFIPAAAEATDGYFTIGTGAKQNGLAGAGVALAQDSTSAAVNPASLVRVGNSWEIGAALFQPYRQYEVDGAPSGAPGTFGLARGTVKSLDNAFLLPNVSWSRRLTAKGAIGLMFYANGGLNTTYPGTGPGTGTFGAGAAGVNIEQIFLAPTYALAAGKGLSLGVSLTAAYQTLRAGGLANFSPFVSNPPATLTNPGTDSSWGIGGRVGALYDVSPQVTVGAAYQSITTQQKFAKYADLFAQQGGFNIPATATLGLALKVDPQSVVALDAEEIWYAQIASVANPFANLVSGITPPGNPSYLLGGSNGPGFGWRDTTFYKLGYQTEVSPHLTLRAGLAYGVQPIPSSEVLFNILAPAVTEWHYSVGASVKVSKQSELSVAAVVVPAVTQSGPNPLEAPGQQRITIGMNQFEVDAGYSRRY